MAIGPKTDVGDHLFAQGGPASNVALPVCGIKTTLESSARRGSTARDLGMVMIVFLGSRHALGLLQDKALSRRWLKCP